jgi:carbonic anhydrase
MLQATTLFVLLAAVHVCSGARPTDEPIVGWQYGRFSDWPGACQTGNAQSPVDFTAVDKALLVTDRTLSPIRLSSGCRFSPQTTIAVALQAHTFTAHLRNASAPTTARCTVLDPLLSVEYAFSHLAIHAGPEHLFLTTNGTSDAEVHLVFRRSDTGASMVLAVPLVAIETTASARKPGASNKGMALLSLLYGAPLPTAARVKVVVPNGGGTTELDDLLPPLDESYFTYHGSLTHPPCSENVRWYVFSSPQFVEVAVLRDLKKALARDMPLSFKEWGNARPPQLLNGRTVRRFVDPFADRSVDADGDPVVFGSSPTAHRLLDGAFVVMSSPPNSLIVAFIAASVTAVTLIVRHKWRHAHEE